MKANAIYTHAGRQRIQYVPETYQDIKVSLIGAPVGSRVEELLEGGTGYQSGYRCFQAVLSEAVQPFCVMEVRAS